MAISAFTIFILALTADYSVSQSGLILATLGEDVSFNCLCPKRMCKDKFIRWIKVAVNGTVTVLDTGCGKSCRISHKSVNDSKKELTLRRIRRDDEGRYYCDKNTSWILKFQGKGTQLQIKEPVVGTNGSQVMLFREFESSMIKPALEKPRTSVLCCLVTALLTPNIIITWHSSQGRVEDGQTWVSDANERFTAGSRLQINVTTGKDSQISQNAEEHRVEWWCEVQGRNQGDFTLRSDMSSIYTSRVSEGCPAVLYSAVALISLCVLSLVLLTSHWILYLRKGAGASVTSATTSQSQDDTSSGVRLQLNERPTPRRQSADGGSEVYSILNFPAVSAVSSSSHQIDKSAGVTYASVDFQRPPRPGRRRKENNRDRQTDIYSAVHFP